MDESSAPRSSAGFSTLGAGGSEEGGGGATRGSEGTLVLLYQKV